MLATASILLMKPNLSVSQPLVSARKGVLVFMALIKFTRRNGHYTIKNSVIYTNNAEKLNERFLHYTTRVATW